MLKRITLIVTSDNKPLYSAWGYALYGMISEKADKAYAEKMHRADGFAVHQYIHGSGLTAEWVVNLLGNEADENLSNIFTQDHFTLDHYQSTLTVQNRQIETISESDFCLQYLAQKEQKRQIKLKFLTPCSFKSQKRYQIFPREEWLINSLWRHWQSYAKEVILDDEEVKSQLAEYIQINGYNLRSVSYMLKGQKIPSFIGTLDLKINGPEPLARLVNLLINFGTYSGVGIKNALGMGGYILL